MSPSQAAAALWLGERQAGLFLPNSSGGPACHAAVRAVSLGASVRSPYRDCLSIDLDELRGLPRVFFSVLTFCCCLRTPPLHARPEGGGEGERGAVVAAGGRVRGGREERSRGQGALVASGSGALAAVRVLGTQGHLGGELSALVSKLLCFHREPQPLIACGYLLCGTDEQVVMMPLHAHLYCVAS